MSWSRTLAYLLVGLALLGLVMASLGPGEVLRAFRDASWGHTLAVAALTVPLVVVRAVRARRLLHANPPYRVLFPVLNASFLLAVATPGRVGALLRPAWLAPHGVPVGDALVGMVAERLLDLVAIGLLVVLTVTWAMPGGEVFGERVALVGWLIGGGVSAGLAGLVALPWLRPGLLRWLPKDGGVRERLRGVVVALADAAQALAAQPARAVEAWGWTLALWGLGLSMGAAIVAGVDPALVRADVVVALWTGVMLANVLSPTPGGVGAYEAAGTAILVGFGADAAQAGAGVLLGHGASLGVQAAFGALGFYGMGRAPGPGDGVAEGAAPH